MKLGVSDEPKEVEGLSGKFVLEIFQLVDLSRPDVSPALEIKLLTKTCNFSSSLKTEQKVFCCFEVLWSSSISSCRTDQEPKVVS